MGVGRSDTPKAFVNACEVFVYTENLTPGPANEVPVPKSGASDWTHMATRAIQMAAQDDGWAFLGAVGTYLRQLDPAFDVRTYGHNQLSPLIKSQPRLFETRESKACGGASLVYVRLRS